MSLINPRSQTWGLFAAIVLAGAILASPALAERGGGDGGKGGGKGDTGSGDPIVPGQVVAKLSSTGDIARITAKYGTSVIKSVEGRNLYSLRVPAGETEATFASKLTKDGKILFAEANRFISYPETQMHLGFDGGNHSNYVNQYAFQQVNLGITHSWTTGAGVIVAVLDTGATFTHPDLAGHYLPGYNAINTAAPPDDIPDTSSNAAVGHGTMVAGIIARIAPGAKILPIKVLNGDGLGNNMDVAAGVHYAIQSGARVINMSFGANQITGTLKDALDEAELAGVMVVASAGNTGKEQVQYPAAGRGGTAVGAVDANNVKADFSSYGSFVRVVAPGVGIMSTNWNGGYSSWSGTSFSAPFVAGQAALLFAANPSLNADLVEEAIRGTAHDIDPLNRAYRGKLGKGIIDIQASVSSVR